MGNSTNAQERTSMPMICAFEELDRTKLAWVGGKGANLGEMTRHDFPVPEGFCITTRAYRELIASDEGLEELFRRLDGVEADAIEEIRQLGEAIRTRIRELPLNEDLQAQIVEAWKKLGEEHFYAVRSSATAEDLPDASFAGQQDTYLNVKGADELIAKVRACWASLFTDRAIVYRVKNHFPHREVALSVVVQRMVKPDVSGIMFTADPLSENRTIISIDASFGLGEAIVSGKVSPDLYLFDKRRKKILKKELGPKEMGIFPLEEGGTVERALDEEMRQRFALFDEQIEELAQLGMKIEEYYGAPQDIEWCLEDGTFYIVQSRPITSLYPAFEDPHPEDLLQLYISFNHIQVMTDPISPMGVSTLTLLLPFGSWGKPATARSQYVNVAGGRMYMNLTQAMRHKIFRKMLPKFFLIADELIAQGVMEFIERERFKEESKGAKTFSAFSILWNVYLPIIRKAIVLFLKPLDEQITAKRSQLIDDEIAKLTKKLEELKEKPKERLHYLFNFMGKLLEDFLVPNFIPLVLLGVSSAHFSAALAGIPFESQDISDLMRAPTGNVTTEMDLRVGDLADVARRYPEVVALLRSEETKGIEEKLKQVEGGEEFLVALKEFLERYGARGASEIDIARLRWHEDPTPLFQMINGNLAEAESGKHRQQHKEMQKRAERAQERIVQAAGKGFWGWLKKLLARRLTRFHRSMMGVREHPKWMLIRTLWIAKNVLFEEGELLVEQGFLDDVQDIFYITWEELFAHLDGRWEELFPAKSMKEVVAERRAKYEFWKKLTPPRVLTSEGEIIRATHSNVEAPEGALIGSSASAGVVEGIARVITSPKDAVLENGEILIAPFTDPGWTPLFINAAGLVMEVGGLMTHGSVVAREYGIPAVVCIPDATTRIKTGQRIRVNGDLGFVEILEEPTEEKA